MAQLEHIEAIEKRRWNAADIRNVDALAAEMVAFFNILPTNRGLGSGIKRALEAWPKIVSMIEMVAFSLPKFTERR